MGTTLRAF